MNAEINKPLVQRLRDALAFEHAYAENWRDYRGIDGLDEFDPLITEADAALSSVDQSREEWLKEANEKLNKLIYDCGNPACDHESSAASVEAMREHFRTVPDTPGMVLVGYKYRGQRSGLVAWSETRHDAKSSPEANFEETALYAASEVKS